MKSVQKDFIGRVEEQNRIFDYYNSKNNEFVAVYGRRRVGKTYLVKKTLENKIDFSFTGTYKEKQKIQLRHFLESLKSKGYNTELKIINDWYQAFDCLKEYLISIKKKTVVVFLDELPWLDTHKSDFLNALSYFWNNLELDGKVLKLFVCGSSTTWMLDKLIGNKGGLYGRISKKIYLAPFTLKETKEYLNVIKKANYSNDQVLDTYMIFGGIPFYLDMIDTLKPLSWNVDNLFFKINGELRNEFDFLFRSLFKITTNYKKVVTALSKKLNGLTRDEIIDLTGIDGGPLSEILNNLRSCDFLRCYSFYEKEKKDKVYQLIDPFTLFHLRFVKDNEGQNETYWKDNIGKPIINSWLGYSFEIVCLNHTNEIKKALGISGIDSSVYSWKTLKRTDINGVEWPGAQIDMIIDRSDKVINLVEIKYSNSEYTITKDYNEKIYNRVDNFKSFTGTKKAVILTFITTNGLKKNEYSLNILSQLSLDDLMN